LNHEGHEEHEEGQAIMEFDKLQLIAYVKLSRIHAGLLINFNVQMLKARLKRLVV
jgi:hypothetical protein